jgi:predicted alpha-1,6-mannanase (GH76 family)
VGLYIKKMATMKNNINFFSFIKLSFAALVTFSLLACSGNDEGEDTEIPKPPTEPSLSKIDWNLAADSCSDKLVELFWLKDKHFFCETQTGTGFQYWHQAHALDGLIDTYLRTKKSSYKQLINDWYEGVKIRNAKDDEPGWNLEFKNDYIDDMEWIALSMVRAYEATNDDRYKVKAVELWGFIKTFWDETYVGGGISWKQRLPHYKNACSNAPACILACWMYNMNNDGADKEMALKIFNWMYNTLYNSSTGAVYDAAIDNGTAGVDINKDANSYNQGTFIGVALELYKITKEAKYLGYAKTAANFTIEKKVSSEKIMLGDPNMNNSIFNGIFIRYFAQLIMNDGLDSSTRNNYINFLNKNAETAWEKGLTKEKVIFDYDWNKSPTGGYTYMPYQLNGCFLIEARALIDKYPKEK